MYRPIKLIVKNFGPFENLEFDFNQGIAHLIQGKNCSDFGSESNGSGKSFFREAINYALLGTSSKKSRDIKLIQRNKDKAYIFFELKNDFLKHTLSIERYIFKKSSSTIKIEIDGIDQKDKFATVNDGNKFLLSLIDISVSDLQSYYLIDRERFISFFNLSDAAKKEFIGDLSNANVVNDVNAKIDLEIKEFDSKISLNETNKISLESLSTILIDDIKTLKEKDYNKILETYLIEKESRADKNKARVTDIKNLLEEYVTTKSSFDFEIERNQKWIRILKTFSYEKLYQTIDEEKSKIELSIDSLNKNRNSILSDIQLYKESLNEIQLSLKEKIECPKCHHIFSLKDKDFNYEESIALESELIVEIERITNELNELQSTIAKSNLKQNALLKRHKDVRIQDIRKDDFISKLNKLVVRYQNQIVEICTNEKRLNDELRELRGFNEDNISIELLKNEDVKEIEKKEVKFEQIQQDIVLNKKELEALIELREQKIQWKSNFKQFYTFLINKSLIYLENQVNTFLNNMKTNLGISMEGYKLLASGEIRENINILVRRNGMLEDELRTYSSGERGKIELAMILTNQNIINSKSNSGGLDLLIIDEILDSIDSLGMQSLVESLNELGRTVYLITHIYLSKSESELGIKIITIKKENYISTIE